MAPVFTVSTTRPISLFLAAMSGGTWAMAVLAAKQKDARKKEREIMTGRSSYACCSWLHLGRADDDTQARFPKRRIDLCPQTPICPSSEGRLANTRRPFVHMR